MRTYYAPPSIFHRIVYAVFYVFDRARVERERHKIVWKNCILSRATRLGRTFEALLIIRKRRNISTKCCLHFCFPLKNLTNSRKIAVFENFFSNSLSLSHSLEELQNPSVVIWFWVQCAMADVQQSRTHGHIIHNMSGNREWVLRY
jgi:hypothetical protein